VGDPLVLRGEEMLEECERAVARDPRATALFSDVDGTVSPIVADPYAAIVPEEFRATLAALAPRLGLTAFVTGRDVRQGAGMVGVPGAWYVGLHGFDVLAPDGSLTRDPAADRWQDEVQAMVRRARMLDAESLGLVLEDKGPMLDLHYRRAPDPAATLDVLEREVLRPARLRGLGIATGHFVVEVRPPEPVSKGTATARLLAGGAFATAVFLGDDLTDCTGFAAVRRWADEGAAAGQPRRAFTVAAITGETPDEVREGGDVWVDATPGVLHVLRRLLQATGG
jgi:trehalose 6-phosphate phosphatase